MTCCHLVKEKKETFYLMQMWNCFYLDTEVLILQWRSVQLYRKYGEKLKLRKFYLEEIIKTT